AVAAEVVGDVVEVERRGPAASSVRALVEHLEDAARRRGEELAAVGAGGDRAEDLRVERHAPGFAAVLRLEREQRTRVVAEVDARAVLAERRRRRRAAGERVV